MERQVKESNIQWIGSIPVQWELTKVKHLFNIGRGRVISQLELTDSGYPVYSSQTKNNGCLGYISTYDFDRSQLTWTTDGANAGTVFLREGKHNCTNVCGTLMPKNGEHNLKFLKYALEFIAIYHKRADINGYKIMNNEMAEILITLPPRREQDAIALFLDRKCAEIDAIIEKTKATIEEYKKLKQSVITEAVTKGIRGDRPMKDSGIEWIGEVPENWAVIKATRIISSTQNGLTRRDLEKSDGQIVLKLKNITADGQISYEEINRIPLSEKEIETYALNDGDFLFVRVNGSKNLVGKSAIYKALSETVAYNDHIIRVRLNSLCDKHYFHWYLLSNAGKTEIDLHTSTAAGQFTISGDGLRDLYIVLPSANEQKEIAEYLDKKCAEIDSLITKKTNLLTELENYKKSLIYEYVTGKKECSERGRFNDYKRKTV